MRHILSLCIVLICLTISPAHSFASGTKSIDPAKPSPPASISGLAWLAGEWLGSGLGGKSTETYSAPSGGQIIGHFRQTKADGSIMFYEILSIAEHKGSLVYRLKHFNADLTGWEEKNEMKTFPLVAVEKGKGGTVHYFDGLTIAQDGPNGMIATVLVASKDGPAKEYVFRYKRTR